MVIEKKPIVRKVIKNVLERQFELATGTSNNVKETLIMYNFVIAAAALLSLRSPQGRGNRSDGSQAI